MSPRRRRRNPPRAKGQEHVQPPGSGHPYRTISYKFGAALDDRQAQEQKKAEHQEPLRLVNVGRGEAAEEAKHVQPAKYDDIDQQFALK